MPAPDVYVLWSPWEPAADTSWLTRLVARWLGEHVWVVMDYGGVCVVAEWTLRGVVLAPCTWDQAWETMQQVGVNRRVVVQYDSIADLHPTPEIGTCVTFVKRIVGVRKWWVVTPNQLYKELTRG